MKLRTKWLALSAVAVLVLGGATAFGVASWADYQRNQSAPSSAQTAEVAPTGPRVVFRNTTAGQGYGLVASVPLGDPAGARAVSAQPCDRVYATEKDLSCLRIERGVVTTFDGTLFDASGKKIDSWPLPGVPSRTRISPDSRLVASTAFITGMSYATVGFSTQTVIRGVDGHDYGNLEDFTTLIDGKKLTAVDRNFWGVTFGAGGEFYATASSSGHSWLVRGDLDARTLTAIGSNAECPSLSPDGSHIAFKRNGSTGPSAQWSIVVLDLASGKESVLAESRSVDDQVEWLDDSTLLYGLTRPDAPGDSDIWSASIAPGSAPALFIPHAWSPSVIR